ncbi:MAG: carboxypeptidase-like regulatory domain-containing protein [Candidatus Bathyarchaeia archaeon]|jgi:hypothetical protein
MRITLLLLLVLLLVSEAPNSAHSDNVGDVNHYTVSPGKYDLTLGAGFPGFGPVKLSYPNSSILTNSVGDLLFTVTLNPLMLNPVSAQVSSSLFPNPEVEVWGSGFSSSDTSCTLSGPVVPVVPCNISGGILTESFNVADAPAGVYTITGTGSPTGDYSSSTFTVLPPSLFLEPSSGPAGMTVSVSGFGFYSTDTTCTLTGDPVPTPTTCIIAGGEITPFTFVVPIGTPTGAYTIVATTNQDDSGEAVASFTVTTTSSPYIALNPSGKDYGYVGDTVTVSGAEFQSADSACTLSGSIVTAVTPCSIAGGVLAPGLQFTVGNVAPGVYTINARGNPEGDSARANFQVLPPLLPPSVPISVTFSVGIYIPPDFAGLTLGNTWTSFTNNYDPHGFSLSKLSSSDQVGPDWWEISLSNITVTHDPSSYLAPLVGRRIFVVNQAQYIRLFQVTSPSIAGRYFFKAFINGKSIGAENFPTIVVKASRDPGYISGVLRDSGEHNASLKGQPIQLANGTGARVLATGFDDLGNAVSAQAYINSTALGSYTLFGVAPGTYNITAYAAGYIPATDYVRVNVGPAQSLEDVDIYLTGSVKITGTVLSENAEGTPIPWGTLTGVSLFGGSRNENRAITVDALNLDGSVAASTAAPFGELQNTDPSSTTFNFAIQQIGFDGRIPQDYANYTSGLTQGDYLLYAYVTSYVQLEEVRVHVDNETIQTFSMIPLIRTGTFIVTVHFRNENGTIGPDEIAVPATLTVSAYGPSGRLSAQNVTFVPAGATEATVELQGFSNTRSFGIRSLFSQNYGLLPGTYQIIASVSSSPTIAGNANLGIRDFYYQMTNVYATIGLGDAVVSISLPVYKAGGILLTIFSIDDQTPWIGGPWNYNAKTINVMIIGSDGEIYRANVTQLGGQTNVNFAYVGLKTDSYSVFVQTLGYTQSEIIHLNVELGGNSDAPVWMIENPVIDLDLAFTHETLLSNITSTLPFAQPINHIDATPVRLEVFDQLGNFVAANATYVPNNTTIAHFTLAGFDLYYGDPRYVWSGFYDTTEGTSQSPGGLVLYPWSDLPREYTVRIWVDGYYQENRLQVLVPTRERGNVSVVQPLDRATRIAGNIAGPDIFEFARPLSWATITLQPNDYTLTRIIDVAPGNYTTYSLDGSFQLWVPEGSYGMGVSLGGYSSYSAKIEVAPGSDINMWIWLDNYQPSLIANAFGFQGDTLVQVAGTTRHQYDRLCLAI